MSPVMPYNKAFKWDLAVFLGKALYNRQIIESKALMSLKLLII